MTITLTSTTQIITLETATGPVLAAVWEGQTDGGAAVRALLLAPADVDLLAPMTCEAVARTLAPEPAYG